MTNEPTPATRSLELLDARVRSIPEVLSRAIEVELPPTPPGLRTVVTSGIGASEAPARWLASCLVQAGIAARFVPLTTFAIERVSASLLVLFSQNLSPNARIALHPMHAFDHTWLVTSAGFVAGASRREPMLHSYRARGVIPIVTPPASEDGMLIRVVGPAVASLTVLRLAARLDVTQAGSLHALPLERAPDLYAAAECEGLALDDESLALVGVGAPLDTLFGHRWKLLETFLSQDPSVWDALQVAHGPLQSIHGRAAHVIAFATPRSTDLLTRLQTALASPRHRMSVVRASRDDALAVFEHMATIDRCLLATLRARPRNLLDWPGRHADAPLYDLGND